MKALVLHTLKMPLKVESRPDLEPGAGEVVVQLKAAALNRRDFWITQGLYPGVEPPVTLGSDGAGVVSGTGNGVSGFAVGDEVLINPGWNWGEEESAQSSAFQILGVPRDGTFATQVLVPAEFLHPKPEHLNWSEAAALPLAGVTAYRAVLTQGRVQSGQKVLISGTGGGVATFALQFARAVGASVFVTSSAADKRQRACDLGATAAYDYTCDGWARQLQQEHGLMNVIIDSAGGEGFADFVQLAAPGGRIVNYGATAGLPKTVDLFKVFWKQLQLYGSTMGSPRDFAGMLELVTGQQLRPVLDESFPLEQGNQALSRMSRCEQFGKIVLTM
ncbi:MAG: zinc-binding dehydrogenase [Planctomycetaceae bacterium]